MVSHLKSYFIFPCEDVERAESDEDTRDSVEDAQSVEDKRTSIKRYKKIQKRE